MISDEAHFYLNEMVNKQNCRLLRYRKSSVCSRETTTLATRDSLVWSYRVGDSRALLFQANHQRGALYSYAANVCNTGIEA